MHPNDNNTHEGIALRARARQEARNCAIAVILVLGILWALWANI